MRSARRRPVRRVAFPPRPAERTHYIVDKFFQFANVKKQTRCLRCRLVARAVDQSTGIVTRNTNSWSGNECFNSANSSPPSSPSIHVPIPFPDPSRSPGTALKIYFHRRTDVTSLSRGSDACIDRQMSLAHPPLRTLSLQSAVNCFQLNCLPFSRHPFAAQRRLFAPLNAARFRDTPNFRRDVETSSVETRNRRGKGSEEPLPLG